MAFDDVVVDGIDDLGERIMLINTTNGIGSMVVYLTNNVTGSLFLTLMFIVILVLAFAMILRVPMEFSAVFVLPLLIGIMAYYGEFVSVGGVFIIYLAIILSKNLWFK